MHKRRYEATDMNICRSALSACVIMGLPNIYDYIHKHRERLMEEKRQKLLAHEVRRNQHQQQQEQEQMRQTLQINQAIPTPPPLPRTSENDNNNNNNNRWH